MMSDIEWQDGDDSALYDSGFSDALESARNRLAVALAETEKALEDIHKRYEGGGFYSTEDSSYQDYYEGQICAYVHAIAVLNGEEK